MGPFPHNAPPAEITAENPAGTDGFAFVEFAHPDPQVLRDLFSTMGFSCVANHKTKEIELWQQGDITYILNAEAHSHAVDFAAKHGPAAPSMGWRVVDADHAFAHAVAKGAQPYSGNGKALDVPAIVGIGGSLIYFVTAATAEQAQAVFAREYIWQGDHQPSGAGFYYIDHLTHNVMRGNMDVWFNFYADIFNFKQIRFFDISGKLTGLFSRALTSPCGRIRIPINESADANSQIEEYLHQYNGEGIQHIAVATEDIYGSTDIIAANGLEFMPAPPATYYAQSSDRVPGHTEPLDRMQMRGILIDGEGVVAGRETKILLQIFSKTVIGPIFFEFIQRKGDDGFGEGNFRALFESIEADQIARGVLSA